MAQKTKGLRIATRCTNMDQFVAAFHRFCDAKTVFISTLNPRSVGLETAFSIDLADNTPALRGIGTVMQSWTSPQNPFGRPGIQLGIKRLTPDSQPILDRLVFAREALAATPTPPEKLMPVIVVKPMPRPPGLKASTPPILPSAEDRHAERTPGGELVLPANPLMNIDDKALEGFVDCTLFEETGTYFGEQAVVEDPNDPIAAPPLLAPRRVTAPMPIVDQTPASPEIPGLPSLAKPKPVINKLTPPMGASAHTAPGQFTLPMFSKQTARANRVIPVETSNTANEIAQRMQQPLHTPPPMPVVGPPPVPSKPWISPETAEMLDIEPDPSVVSPLPQDPSQSGPAMIVSAPADYVEQTYPSYEPQTHASDRYTAQPPPQIHISQQFPVPAYRAPQKSRRTLVIGATAAVTVTIAIALIASRGGDKKPVAAAPPEKAPTLVAASTNNVHLGTEAPAPAPAPAPVAETTETPDEGGPTVIGKGPCKLAISTTPAGSMIAIDGEQLGPSPLVVAGPCAARKIDIVHPRYASVQKTITPKTEDTLDVTLMRPTHNLFVDSTPSGATVSIDGHRAGTTPTMVKVMGFTTVTLAISKPGFKTASKKFYSKIPSDRASVKLAR
ncbi:MAG: PEGA domain-containing protein [Kofleriaceae bacterium]